MTEKVTNCETAGSRERRRPEERRAKEKGRREAGRSPFKGTPFMILHQPGLVS